MDHKNKIENKIENIQTILQEKPQAFCEYMSENVSNLHCNFFLIFFLTQLAQSRHAVLSHRTSHIITSGVKVSPLILGVTV